MRFYLFLTIFFLSHVALAEDAVEHTKRLITTASELIAMDDGKEKSYSFCSFFGENIQMAELRSNTVGKIMASAPADQKQKAMSIFPSYIVSAYFSKLRLNLPLIGEIDPNPTTEGKKIIVKASALMGASTVEFIYEQKGEKLLLVDIKAAGMSLVETLNDDLKSANSQGLLTAGMERVTKNYLGTCQKEAFQTLDDINNSSTRVASQDRKDVNTSTTQKLEAGGTDPSIFGNTKMKADPAGIEPGY